MTQTQIERNREFIKDLRANKLKAIGRMRDENGGRCCLCVAYDTAQRLGAGLPAASCLTPPQQMAEFYGWPCLNPILRGRYASDHNDGDCSHTPELTHCEIADLFEQTFPEIKP